MLVDRDEEQNRCCVIHDDMVLKLLQNLDAHKSMGPDGLQPGVLRELADVALDHPLAVLANQVCPGRLETGRCDTHLQKGPER